jgi:hypothetical protein
MQGMRGDGWSRTAVEAAADADVGVRDEGDVVFNVSRQEVKRGVGSEVVSPNLVRERCPSRVVCTASS